MSQGQQERFRFESEGIESNAFHVVRFVGTEGLNKLYRFEITLASALADMDLDKLLQASARLILMRGGKSAIFSGLLSSVTQDTHYNGYTFYTVVLQPRFWKLTQLVQNHIYLNKNLEDTVKEALNFDEAFRVDTRFNLLSADYPQHEFSLQYNESVYDYCANKLEAEGVYYFFEQNGAGDSERVVFTDSHMGHTPLAETPGLMYSPVTGMEASHAEEVITSFSLRKTPLPKTVILRAYNWQTPNTPVVAEATVSPSGLGEVYYSDNNFTTTAEGQRLAKIRAEELRCQGTVFSGISAVPTLRPGFLFALERHYQASFNREYMITEVTHEGSQEGFLSSTLGIRMEHGNDYYYYRNSFTAIRSDEQFRAPRVTPRVKMQGVVTAFVDGAGKAAKPELDSHGRYKVIFSFDMSGRKEGKGSCWLRMSQPHVGVGYGTSFPLTPGIEVTVAFVDGNPDRPLITGALTNTESGPLVNNTNSTAAGITSASGNSLVFNEEDAKQGIALSTASGRSGLIMSSGSTDYMQVSSDYNMFATNLLSTNLGGVGTSAWTAFRKQDITGMGDAYTAMMMAVQTLNSVSNVFNAKGTAEDNKAAAAQAAGDPTQSGGWDAVGWKTGATTVKALSQAIPLIVVSKLIKKEPMYSYQVVAKKDTVKRLMLQAPSTKEFVGHAILGFLGSVVSSGVAQGGEFLEIEAEKEKALQAGDPNALAKYETAKAQAKRSILSSSLADLLPEIITFCLSFLPVYKKLNKKTMGGIYVTTDSNILTHSTKDTIVNSERHIILQAGGNWNLLQKEASSALQANLDDYLEKYFVGFVPNLDHGKGKYLVLDANHTVQIADTSFEYIHKEKQITCTENMTFLLDVGSKQKQSLLKSQIENLQIQLLNMQSEIAFMTACEAIDFSGELESLAPSLESTTQEIAEKTNALLELRTLGFLKLEKAGKAAKLLGKAQGEDSLILFERSSQPQEPPFTAPVTAPVQTISLKKDGITLSHKPDNGVDVAEIRLLGDNKAGRKITIQLGPTANECSVVIEDKKITLTGPQNESSIVLDKDGITLKGETIKLNADGKITTFSGSKVSFPKVELNGGSKINFC